MPFNWISYVCILGQQFTKTHKHACIFESTGIQNEYRGQKICEGSRSLAGIQKVKFNKGYVHCHLGIFFNINCDV